MKTVFVRGKEFESFRDWLGKALGRPEFDRDNPHPTDAAKRVLEYLEPLIGRKAMQEAANIASTSGDSVPERILKRAEELQ